MDVLAKRLMKIAAEVAASVPDEKLVDEAIDYVRLNKEWGEDAEDEALDTMEQLRCGIDYADSVIADEIAELLDEFGEEEHGLPEDWWRDYVTVNDVFMRL